MGWWVTPSSTSASAASTITQEAARTQESPPLLFLVVSFDDGENNGLLFGKNDGHGTSDQEPGEDQNIVTTDMSPASPPRARRVRLARRACVQLLRRRLSLFLSTIARIEDFSSTGMMAKIPATRSPARMRILLWWIDHHFAAGIPPRRIAKSTICYIMWSDRWA